MPPSGSTEVISITSNPNILCIQGVPFSLTLQAQGNTGTLSWTVTAGQLPAGLTLNAKTGMVSGTTTFSDGSPVTIQAADSKASASKQFTIFVAPKLSISPVTPPNAHINAPYSFSITDQGPFADSWTISAGQLPPGLALTAAANTGAATISGTPTKLGTYAMTLQAQTTAPAQTATVNLTIVVDSHVVVIKSSLKYGFQTRPYSDSFVAIDGTLPYHWSLVANGGTQLPAGLVLDPATGILSGTPTSSGIFSYTVTVTDSSSPQQTDSADNNSGVIGIPQLSVNLGPAYINVPYNGTISVQNGFPSYQWSVTSGSLPPGISYQVGQYSLLFLGTPTQLGSYNFVLQLTDSSNPPFVVSQPITLNVTPTPIDISRTPLSPAPVNVLYHSQIPISGGTPPYVLAINSGTLPPGLTFDGGTGFIDGTPTQNGTFNFQVKGTDSSNPQQTATANDFIQIHSGLGRNDSIATATPIGNTPPSNLSLSPYIDPINAAVANPDTDFYKLVASGGSIVHTETFANRNSNNPIIDTVIELLDQNGNRLHTCTAPGYTSVCLNDDLDSTTTDSALDYKVAGAANTNPPFYLHVFDWRGDARPDMVYLLGISGVIEPVVIAPAILGTGSIRGVNFQQQFTTTGGTGGVTWSLASGAFPPGWSITPSGLLHGMATTDGSYTFTIKATDSSNPTPQFTTAQYTMQIAEPLVITSSPNLPNGCVGQPYNYPLTSTGGIPPVTFGTEYSTDTWPFAFSQNPPAILGPPIAAGNFSVNIAASDSAQPMSIVGQTLTVTVLTCP